MEAKDVFTLYRIGFVCDMHVVSGHVSTLEICAAQLHSVTEIAPKSLFLCVNTSPGIE